MKRQRLRPKMEVLSLSTVDRGRELELHTEFDGFAHAVTSIVADEKDESLWVQIQVGEKVVEIPLKVFQDFLTSAEGHVHSEAWFEQNLEGYSDDGLSAAARAFMKREP